MSTSRTSGSPSGADADRPGPARVEPTTGSTGAPGTARAHEEVSRPPSSSGSRRVAHGDQRRRVGSGCRASRRRKRFRDCLWNAALIAGFYTIYALIRNVKGSAITEELEARALHHGLLILDVERTLRLDHEATIQSFFLRLPALMKASNIFYATTHFIVTSAVLAALTVAGGRHHTRWRNILAVATAMALVCFALYPTMPPRLLPDHPALIDTLSEIGGFWSFQTPAIEKIADPFAAVPSLHVVWAAWVACALWSRISRWWLRVLAITYPVVTSVVVVATANHYVLDLVAALGVLGLAWLLVRGLDGRTPEVAPADPEVRLP